MPTLEKRDCECWEYTVWLYFPGSEFPKEAVRHIYCPRCSQGIRKNEVTMMGLEDWLIEYDPQLPEAARSDLLLIRIYKKERSLPVYSTQYEILSAPL